MDRIVPGLSLVPLWLAVGPPLAVVCLILVCPYFLKFIASCGLRCVVSIAASSRSSHHNLQYRVVSFSVAYQSRTWLFFLNNSMFSTIVIVHQPCAVHASMMRQPQMSSSPYSSSAFLSCGMTSPYDLPALPSTLEPGAWLRPQDHQQP